MKKIFGKFTFMMLAAIIAMVSMCFVSCGSDDDDVVATSSYSLEISLSGGGLSESELATYNNQFKELVEKSPLENVTRDQAESAYNTMAGQIKTILAPVVKEGTLTVTMKLTDLKTKLVVKSNTISVTKSN